MKDAKAVCHLSIRNLLIKDRPPFLHSAKAWSEATKFWREGPGQLARRVRHYKRKPMWPEGKLSSGLERSDRILARRMLHPHSGIVLGFFNALSDDRRSNQPLPCHLERSRSAGDDGVERSRECGS
jgi:hypothetical protein